MALHGKPQDLPIRPVTKGIINDVPTTDVEPGAWLEQNNYKTFEQNIHRSGGFAQFFKPGQYTDVDRADLITYWETIHERIDKFLEFEDTTNNSEYIALTEFGVRRIVGNPGDDASYELINPRINITGIVSINQAAEPWIVTVPTANITTQATVGNAQNYTAKVGDLFYAEDATGYIPVGRITEINVSAPNSLLSVQPSLTGVSLAGLLTTGRIQHIFQETDGSGFEPERLQWTHLAEDGDNMIIITNNAYKLSDIDTGGYVLRQTGYDVKFLELDGSPSADIPSIDTVDIKSFRTCTTFGSRLFIGNTQEEYSSTPGTNEKTYRRVRWSLIDSITDADAKFRFYPEHYIDLPNTTGELIKLLPLSDLLIAYFTDGIYIGRPTSRPELPVGFTKLETGGRGLVSAYAVTAVDDNHFFVSSDDIYVLSANMGFNPMNFPAVEETLGSYIPYGHIVAEVDADHSRICFGFPRVGSPSVAERNNRSFYFIWSYMYKRKAWYLEEATYTLSNNVKAYHYGFNSLSVLNNLTITTGNVLWSTYISSGIQWDEIDTTWEALLVFDSRPSVLLHGLLFEPNETDLYNLGNFYYRSLSSGTDILRGALTVGAVTYPALEYDVKSELITADFDMNAPNVEKTFNRLSIRLSKAATEAIVLSIYGSVDAGDSYKNLGAMTIRSGSREGKIDFRLTGSVGRFKIVQSSNQKVYEIEEYVLRVLIRGAEVDIN